MEIKVHKALLTDSTFRSGVKLQQFFIFTLIVFLNAYQLIFLHLMVFP